MRLNSDRQIAQVLIDTKVVGVNDVIPAPRFGCSPVKCKRSSVVVYEANSNIIIWTIIILGEKGSPNEQHRQRIGMKRLFSPPPAPTYLLDIHGSKNRFPIVMAPPTGQTISSSRSHFSVQQAMDSF